MKFTDTITAISTAFGNAGIAIVRISGNKSLPILKKIFKAKDDKNKFETHKLIYGKILDKKSETIDEVLSVYFKKPNTYTMEDIIEIQCHGGYITANIILKRILEEGVRMAKPGEFTERAFLSGRIDLTQAEAVLDIIHAKTEKAQKIAENQLQGSLKKKIKSILDYLLNIYTQILANIDFPDEDTPEITKKEIEKKITKPIKEIEEILSGAATGTIYKEGLKVAIVGLPNVGKSSILNSLVKDARAIVTDIPGTTRDILEDQIEIRGLLVRLFDTAGITSTEDKIEKEGIKRSLKAIKNADLLLFVIENNNDIEKFMSHLKPEVKGQFKNKQIILIKNKIDLYKKKTSIKDIFGMKIIKICECSAKTGKGIREIENTIFNEIQKNEADESILITNVRHQKLLDKSLKNLKKAKELARAQEPEDKILIEFDEANKALGEIIGEITTDDILDKIFSMFCIGK
ncbi:tRNA uridine-5-carboxymethylaminomethyl(34) synthesis GTPase MnmE [bacterium CG_4_10_14_0_2_um_filter_33_32]|nr:MAG: tRNA uridine-5-carboxymethylaminomethyl(34) synthesis GTPase MnmE [bacterium CG2_30_33_46]PIR68018.1 MAG: tRNA uridine-5-carboxymethylaminomethyl(34) synthesis GTPase MnmE [bacterium CG10_big_fil_rev_8_21_14_0_10_33_18]PIU76283.1 MAG: tRNA uridine-5-carboxymethylaminomethyl(34) synthesis GTPase MnmE [bacterium CG06_land_8_20_14_3_00_33_50]PIW81131.1 MAG: tRNA uridine-5-carboxymethylaminomethyl(34) synthesis GTPase MnmE [bacterium CG_4_8_14_3_um_filter_33_28]PIY85654.1 MAG: tRNA uridine-